MLSVDGNLVAHDRAIFVGDDAVVWTIFFFTSIFGDGHHQIGGFRAGNGELAGIIRLCFLNFISIAVIPLISQLAGAVRPHREARLNVRGIVRRDDTIKVLRLADDIRLAVRLAAANGAVAVGVVTVHVGRDLALGGVDFAHHIAAYRAGNIVNVGFFCGFDAVRHRVSFGVRCDVNPNTAIGADLPVFLPVMLIGGAFVFVAAMHAAAVAEVIGILAVSVLTVLGTGLAQAADFAQRFLAGTLAAVGAGVGVPIAGVIRADLVLFAVVVALRAHLAGLAQLIGIEALSTVRAHMLVFVVGVLFAAVVLAVGARGTGRAAPAELAGVVAGALAAFGAKVILVVAALDAQIVVAATSFGIFTAAFLAQATVVAYLKTRTVPAAIALQAAGQVSAA